MESCCLIFNSLDREEVTPECIDEFACQGKDIKLLLVLVRIRKTASQQINAS
jgi:hypothetical protein